MIGPPVFRLVALAELKEHEEVDPTKVEELVEDIRRSGTVADPVWVAAGSGVILNGHHRVAALRRLGAARVPAWVMEYHSPTVRLARWTPGPAILKSEVEAHAQRGELFAPKTTRHTVVPAPPHRSTPLADLIGPAPVRDQPRASRSPGRRGAPASDTT
jgi:hypothetical protein